VRPEQIWQLTRDHSVVQEKLRAGVITRTQLKTDRSKNVLTRSVGFEPFLEIDIYQMDILSGDTFLLCSDGLYGLVEDGNIRDVICNENSLEKTVDTLIATANKNGGNDNVTAIAIKCI
jgi:protein phosphatase